MKRTIFTIVVLLNVCIVTSFLSAQNYPNIVNYYINGNPTYGVKIKTNLPFANGTHMPTITITGYSYGYTSPISLTLIYYIWSDAFYQSKISSSGNYTPRILLSNENGKLSFLLMI